MPAADDKLILASASPRRRELLKTIVSRFEISPCPLAEPSSKPAAVSAAAWAEALAYFKARAVAERHPRRWVLGADTVVVCANSLLGKPVDAEDARRNAEARQRAAEETALAVLRSLAVAA